MKEKETPPMRLFSVSLLVFLLPQYHSGFRVLAWDHGVLSFLDVSDTKLTSTGEAESNDPFPIVMPLSPKDARFVSPFEPLNILQSTHIRALAYAAPGRTVASVSVSVDDGTPLAMRAVQASGTGNITIYPAGRCVVEFTRH
jgi:hypothetical protein